MAGQDITNVAYTWMVRAMQEGGGKWIVEKSTVPDIKKSLNNRLDEPLIWQRNTNLNSTAPTRSAPPAMNSALTELIRLTPEWMKEQLNLSDVQFGKSSKRGEAGKALQLKVDVAEIPLDKIRLSDELVYNDLMTGTLIDGIKHSRLDQLRNLLGGEIPDDTIRAIKRSNPSQTLTKVMITPATLRPRTQTQTKEEFITLANAQLIEPLDAQWEMLIQGRITINTPMANAYHKQRYEIAAMKGGTVMDVDIGDEHQWHIKTLRHVINSQEHLAMDEKVQDQLRQHLVQHMEAIQQLAIFESGAAQLQEQNAQGQSSQGQLPSPPAGAVAGAAQIAGQGAPAPIEAVA